MQLVRRYYPHILDCGVGLVVLAAGLQLLHLRYRHDGKQFKATMTAAVPNWREPEQASRHSTERQTEREVKVHDHSR